MSGSDHRKNDKLHAAVMRAQLDAQVWRDSRDRIAALQWLFWHRPYFELCPDNPERDWNQRLRAYLSRYLDEKPAQEAPDGHLGTGIGLKKGEAAVSRRLMIVAGDIEGAERLAKSTGLPLEDCIEVYSRINYLNHPSYMGGDLIQKGVPQPSALAALDALRYATADHTRAVAGNGIDPQITKARVDAAETQCHVELVKMARTRPVAVGDRGVIAIMGPGGRL